LQYGAPLSPPTFEESGRIASSKKEKDMNKASINQREIEKFEDLYAK
jgi:hypothetical protein